MKNYKIKSGQFSATIQTEEAAEIRTVAVMAFAQFLKPNTSLGIIINVRGGDYNRSWYLGTEKVLKSMGVSFRKP